MRNRTIITKEIMHSMFVFLTSLALYLICTPLRGYVGAYHAATIETIVYAGVTYLLLKKFTQNGKGITSVLFFMVLGRIIIELPIRIMDYESTKASLMVTVFAVLSILLTGWVFYSRKIYTLVISLAIWGYSVFIGHYQWIDYVHFGTFPKLQLTSYTVQTADSDLLLDTVKAEYILLDFWHASCGVCIRELPHFQEIYNQYKNDILIQSVFVRYQENEEISDGAEIIHERGCDFPLWSVDKNNALLKNLGVNLYPTVVIVDKDKNVIYKGNLVYAEKKMHDLLK